MIRKILNFFGYEIVYVCTWGIYYHRYDSLDFKALRPVHPDMSVAPPWARLKIIKL